MKALTIRQPWASLTLMIDGNGVAFKRVETRSRRTNYRGRVAIHAGASRKCVPFTAMGDWSCFWMAGIGTNSEVDALPHGAIIGEATIKDCVPIDELLHTPYCTAQEVAFGDWREGQGRFGWILEDPVLYDIPIPARGQLGLWNWDGMK